MGISRENRKKNKAILNGVSKKNGFDMWRHSFTGFSKITGEQRCFFIELCILNPALSPKKVTFGDKTSIDKKETKPSFLMVKAGIWGENSKQLHAFYPIEKMIINKRKLNLQIDSIIMSECDLIGSINTNNLKEILIPDCMNISGSMSWSLKMDKRIPFTAKKTNAPMAWFVQGCKTLYGGTVTFDNEEFTVLPQKSFGHADKMWGKDFPNPFIWLSSSNLISVISAQHLSSSCFDICGVFGKNKDSKNIQIFFHHQDKSYVFSNIGAFSKNKITFNFTQTADVGHWIISAQNNKYLMDVDVYCKKSDMLFNNYVNPQGLIPHKTLWSGGNGIGEIRLYKKIKKSLEIIEQARIENCGCEYGAY